MQKEFSFGIIPLRKTKKGFELFLVQHGAGHWGFPKGHRARDNEEPKVTAARELKEETGLDILAFVPVDPLFESYIFTREGKKVEKHVTYFFAEVQGEITLQKEEIKAGEWLSPSLAEKRVTFKEAKALCFEAKRVISTLVPLT